MATAPKTANVVPTGMTIASQLKLSLSVLVSFCLGVNVVAVAIVVGGGGGGGGSGAIKENVIEIDNHSKP